MPKKKPSTKTSKPGFSPVIAMAILIALALFIGGAIFFYSTITELNDNNTTSVTVKTNKSTNTATNTNVNSNTNINANLNVYSNTNSNTTIPADWKYFDSSQIEGMKTKNPSLRIAYPTTMDSDIWLGSLALTERPSDTTWGYINVDWGGPPESENEFSQRCMTNIENNFGGTIAIEEEKSLQVSTWPAKYVRFQVTADNGVFKGGFVCGSSPTFNFGLMARPDDSLKFWSDFETILGSIQFTDATANWKTYSNTDDGYSFKYPSDMTVTKGSDSISVANALVTQKASIKKINRAWDINNIQGIYGKKSDTQTVMVGNQAGRSFVEGDAGCGGTFVQTSLYETKILQIYFGKCDDGTNVWESDIEQRNLFISTFQFTE